MRLVHFSKRHISLLNPILIYYCLLDINHNEITEDEIIRASVKLKVRDLIRVLVRALTWFWRVVLSQICRNNPWFILLLSQATMMRLIIIDLFLYWILNNCFIIIWLTEAFTDFSQAFNNVSHSILPRNLKAFTP